MEIDYGINVGYRVIGSEMPIVYTVDLLILGNTIKILIGAAVYQKKLKIGSISTHKNGHMGYINIHEPQEMDGSFIVLMYSGNPIVGYLEYSLEDNGLYLHTGEEIPSNYRKEDALLYPEKYNRQILLTEIECKVILSRFDKCSEEFDRDPKGYADAWSQEPT